MIRLKIPVGHLKFVTLKNMVGIIVSSPRTI